MCIIILYVFMYHVTLTIIMMTVNQKLPFTMEPEYQAASRAYMRYHNMNPIFGISSK